MSEVHYNDGRVRHLTRYERELELADEGSRLELFRASPSVESFQGLSSYHQEEIIISSLTQDLPDENSKRNAALIAREQFGAISDAARQRVAVQVMTSISVGRAADNDNPSTYSNGEESDERWGHFFAIATAGDRQTGRTILCHLLDGLGPLLKPTNDGEPAADKPLRGYFARMYFTAQSILQSHQLLAKDEKLFCNSGRRDKEIFEAGALLKSLKIEYDEAIKMRKRIDAQMESRRQEWLRAGREESLSSIVIGSACSNREIRRHLKEYVDVNTRTPVGVQNYIVVREGDCQIEGVLSRERNGFFYFRFPRRPEETHPRIIRFASLAEAVVLFRANQRPLPKVNNPENHPPPEDHVGFAWTNPFGNPKFEMGTR